MQYNFNKHYYDPYDSLDAEWKARISHDWLSIGEAVSVVLTNDTLQNA